MFKRSLNLIAFALLFTINHRADAQGTWKFIKAPVTLDTTMLLTDGTVIAQEYLTNNWWKLTPDDFGNYANGTWTQIASMASDYGPLYYASGVLADGRVVVIGGEYNFGNPVWTNKGAIYDPIANVWTSLSHPAGWDSIGDAQCAVMPDGRFFLASLDTRMAWLDPVTLTWTALAATGKQGIFNEEGWVVLPDGNLLTVDCRTAPNTEIYKTAQDKWVSAGNTLDLLVDPGTIEMGAMVLRPDGTVFAIGALPKTAIYDFNTGTWSKGPDTPLDQFGQQVQQEDGGAVLLPNGNILTMMSPGVFAPPTSFWEVEYKTNKFIAVPPTQDALNEPCYVGRMIMLPSGQVLVTEDSDNVSIYTPTGTYDPAWQPTITSCPNKVELGNTYVIQGTQFNGLSQGSFYGDDAGQFTNYPLVRVTNKATGHVTYFRTHDHSTMGVATGSLPVFTNFDVPKTAETGPSTLEVVANGIPSTPFDILVVPPVISLTLNPKKVFVGDPSIATVTLKDPGAQPNGTVIVVTSDNPEAVVPPTVTVPPGAFTTNFEVDTVDAGNAPSVANITVALGPDSATKPLTIIPYVQSVEFLDGIFWVPTIAVTGGQFVNSRVIIADLAPTPGGIVVSLSSGDPNVCQVTPSITVPAGQRVQYFYTFTRPVAFDQAVQIKATARGSSAAGTVIVLAPIPTRIALSPTTVEGGKLSGGTVFLTGVAPNTGLDIALSSDKPEAIPPSVAHIQPGRSSGTFVVNTVPVANKVVANISASYNGTTVSAPLTITGAGLQSFSISPTQIAAGAAARATAVISSPAPAGGVTVNLSYINGSALVNPPVSIPIAQGATSGSVSLVGAVVTNSTAVTVTATYKSTSKQATVTVLGNRVISVTANPQTLHVNTKASCRVYLASPAPSGGSVVLLSATAGQVPSQVLVPFGQTSAAFNYTAPINVPPGGKATITATYPAGISVTTVVSIIP